MAGTYNPGQPRAPKGTSIGGRWVKTPGGGQRPPGPDTLKHRKGRIYKKGQYSPGRQHWVPGTFIDQPFENTIEEDQWRAEEEDHVRWQAAKDARERAEFLQRKREAAARFNDKEKVAHAAGMRGPATIRKELREKEKAGLLTKRAFNLGKEGVWKKNWRNDKWQQVRMGWVAGDKTKNAQSPEGKHRLKEIQPNGVHVWTRVTPPKGATTLAREKHERHEILRREKELGVFLENKRIAGRRHIAKQKGVSFATPAKPNIGDVSPGGKFKFDFMRDKAGRRKLGWKLIPTDRRAGAVPQARFNAVVAGRQPAPVRPKTVIGTNFRDRIPTAQLNREQDARGLAVRRTDDGKDVFTHNPNRRGAGGIFDKDFVTDQNGVEYILKSDGYGTSGSVRGIQRGFAHREVAGYEISKELGLDIVPETSAKIISGYPIHNEQGPYHSAQKIVDDSDVGANIGVSSVPSKLADPEEISKMLLFDIVTGNTDRHGNNFIVSGVRGASPKHLHAIDNGLILTDDDPNPANVKSNWRASDLLPGGRRSKAKLNRKYQQNLKTAIDTGSLERIIRDVEAHSLGGSGDRNKPKECADAAMERARTLAKDWDNYFED